MKAALFGNDAGLVNKVYGQGRREKLAGLVDLYPEIVSAAEFDRHAPRLRDVEAVFSTWGFWPLSAAQHAALPRLRAVFYGAGSVRAFAEPLLEQGITVVSAWGANAVPVAEFTLAQILLANKGYFRNVREYGADGHSHGGAFRGPGNYGETVALLGAGQVARTLIGLLRPLALRTLVYDPYLSADAAAALGVTRVSLPEAFQRAFVVSNHMPNLPEIRGILNRPLFESLQPGAVFINTGRGAQVVEADLIAVLRARPDLTALLDVTDPEPPAANSPLFALPNVRLSSHIAGSINDEVVRMADALMEEFQAWQAGRPLRYAITLEMLPRLG